jgi:hypothetical protein
VKIVTIYHPILTKIKTETGCLKTFTSYVPSIIKRSTDKNITTITMGSSGRLIPSPMPISSNSMASGTIKLRRSKTVSSLNKTKYANKSINGKT